MGVAYRVFCQTAQQLDAIVYRLSRRGLSLGAPLTAGQGGASYVRQALAHRAKVAFGKTVRRLDCETDTFPARTMERAGAPLRARSQWSAGAGASETRPMRHRRCSATAGRGEALTLDDQKLWIRPMPAPNWLRDDDGELLKPFPIDAVASTISPSLSVVPFAR